MCSDDFKTRENDDPNISCLFLIHLDLKFNSGVSIVIRSVTEGGITRLNSRLNLVLRYQDYIKQQQVQHLLMIQYSIHC